MFMELFEIDQQMNEMKLLLIVSLCGCVSDLQSGPSIRLSSIVLIDD